MPVNTVRRDYSDWLPKWVRCRDCYDGSDAVKAGAHRYLPPLDSQVVNQPEKYNQYALRALFYNAMSRTVDGFAGAVFQKAPTTVVPPAMKGDLDDITLGNVPFDLFGLKTTKEVLIQGRYGILVDMAGDASPKQRPYWVGYRTEDIVGWRTARLGGDEILTRVVLREFVEQDDPKDPFVTVLAEQYRVLSLVGGVYSQTLYRKVSNEADFTPYIAPDASEPQLTPQRRGTPLNFIPFVFIGPTTVSPKVEKPPLLDLADVNLSHYRTMADLEHGRHFTALPTPWVAGMLGTDTGPMQIGAGTAWMLDVNGKAGMLEFTGAGLGHLATAETTKRQMMATLGARLLETQNDIEETATAVEMRHSGEHATLKTIAQAVELGLSYCLRWHAWWVGTDAEPDDVKASVELNKDFWSVRLNSNDLRAQVIALQADAISYATFYDNIRKGGWTREGIDAATEQAEIERQQQTTVSIKGIPLPQERPGKGLLPDQAPAGGTTVTGGGPGKPVKVTTTTPPTAPPAAPPDGTKK